MHSFPLTVDNRTVVLGQFMFYASQITLEGNVDTNYVKVLLCYRSLMLVMYSYS